MSPTPVVHLAPNNRVDAETNARLTKLVTKLVTRRDVHHATVALANGDGHRYWAAGAGPAGNAPQFDTPFFIASITKRFIIALVLQAYENAELDLASPITRYLPPEVTDGLHTLSGVDHTPQITVRHLASHSSGLPDHFEKRRTGQSLNKQLAIGQDLAWTFDDMLQVTRDQQRPYFPPQDLTATRHKARYSDTGFQLLIHILETVTHRAFADLLAERILDPLNMQHTWLPGHRRSDQRQTPSELYAKQRRVKLPRFLASTNDLVSTTDDLLVFGRALLAGTVFQHGQTRQSLAERPNRLRNIPVLRYGLGTMFFNVNRLAMAGRTPVTLEGHSGGTGAWLFYSPERDVHLVGTVDQTTGQALPFRFMARCLRAWHS